MSEREGRYCERHVRWCADGVCEDCGPASAEAGGYLLPPELAAAMRQHWAEGRFVIKGVPVVLDPNGGPREFTLIGVAERSCDHASGYCKDTAHKYLPCFWRARR